MWWLQNKISSLLFQALIPILCVALLVLFRPIVPFSILDIGLPVVVPNIVLNVALFLRVVAQLRVYLFAALLAIVPFSVFASTQYCYLTQQMLPEISPEEGTHDCLMTIAGTGAHLPAQYGDSGGVYGGPAIFLF